MNRLVSLSRHLRLVLAAALATPVAITLAASPGSSAQAALAGVTPFEIDSNTTVQSGTDWISKFAAGEVAVANDVNFTGAAIVQSDVGSSTTAPNWLANCPASNTDSVFKNSTNIQDSDWTGDHETQSVTPKNDVCQSYFAVDVVESGPRVGHIIAYVAFTRRVFNGDGSYYFLLSKGANPDVRVAGDIVIEVDYGSQGDAQGLRTATWGGTPLALGSVVDVGVSNANVELSPVQYFAEVALDLTALNLAPNVFDLPTPESCQAFGFGRVISRTGNSASATLKDDGEPGELDFNVCGTLIVEKVLTTGVPGTHEFPAVVTPPDTVTMDGDFVLTVPGDPVTFEALPPSSDGYNVWEPLTGDLADRWDLVSIVCENDNATPDDATDDPAPVEIESQDDTFPLGTFETVTCTVTNSPAPAVINVDKDADGGDGMWPVALSGDASDSVDVTDDGTIDFTSAGTFESFGELAAGSYTLTEGDEEADGAFRPSGWSCTVVGGSTTTAIGPAIGVSANPGDVINCTITNTPVAPPDVRVEKSALPGSFPETATAPGSPIVYTVVVHNDGDEPFTITNLTDAVEGGAAFDLDAAVAGNAAGLAGATIVSNDCGGLIGDSVASGASTSCQFSVAYTGRNAGDVIDDVVTGFVIDVFGRTDSDADDASVTVTDVLPALVVDKQNVAVNGSTAVVAPGGPATYSISITNPASAIEPITLTDVTDTLSTSGSGFGATDINYFTVADPVTATTCANFVGTELDPGESVTCQFTIDTNEVGPLAEDDVLTNRVDVTAEDDDGNEVDGFDTASRTVLGEPPALSVFKTDNGAQIDEPGENITYDVTMTNLSVTEPLTITTITDEVFFTPDGGSQESRGSLVIDAGAVDTTGLVGVTLVDTDCDDRIGTTLAVNGEAGDETSCTITLALTGNAGDSYHDIVTVVAVDDEGTPAEAENEADTPVVDVLPVISIVKDVAPGSVPETGGQVTYTLTITNDSVATDPLTLTSLSDSVFGSFFPVTDLTGVDSTDCDDLQGDVVQPGDSATCTITATISGEAGATHDNIASVTGQDDEGNSDSDSDDASVLFTDVLPEIVVTKTADDTSVPESGQVVTFTVTVENATLEPVMTTGLVDAINGGAAIDLVEVQGSTCLDGVPLAADDGVDGSGLDFYSCTFTRLVAQVDAELSHHDIVTVTAEDDEDNPTSDDDDETVAFELIPPTVLITKTDADATVNEPGGDVTYTIDITNDSFEPVTVTTLTDTISYEIPDVDIVVDLLDPEAPVSAFECHDAADAQIDITTYSLAPDETVTCTFDVTLAGTAQIVRDVVNVIVVDNDGQTDGDDDDEATPIVDVLPEVQIVKTADKVAVDAGDEVTYTFVISNLSDVESLTLLTLSDDKFGTFVPSASDVPGTNCDDLDGFVLAPNDGQPGGADETTCTLTRTLDQAPGTTHTNVVTVTGEDDEGNPASDTDTEAVRILAPQVAVTKTVTSATRDAGGLWTIAYSVVVANTGDGRAVLDVEDTLSFGGGVNVQTVGVVGPESVTLNPAFDGATNDVIANDVIVPAGTTHTYTVTVTARIDSPQPGQGDCDPEGTENGGFLNTVTLRSARTGAVVDSDFACAPFSTLTLVKSLVNNSGGTGTLADFVLTAIANGVTHVQGTGTVTAAVPAGTYALAETTKPGYASSGFSCSTGQAGSSVTVPEATDVTCTISNEDEPVADVAIVKNASVPQVGAGGGFTWLLDVTNNGPDPAVAVVVSDIVPGQVTVTGVTSAQFTCSNSGNTVTCTKPSMAVGETGSISIAVTVPAVAASGSVVNIGSVTATTPDNNASNNSDDASVTIVAQAPPPPTPPPVILPPTGSNSTTPVTWAAISLVLIGGMVMLVSRRRRDHTSVR